MNTDTVVLARLAVRAVVADAGAAGLELAERVAGDDPVEVGVAERAERRAASGRTSSLAPTPGPVDDGRQRDRLARPRSASRSAS